MTSPLLLVANRVVSRDQLIDALWGEDPPDGVGNALHAAISRLRRGLGSEAPILTRSHGYAIEIDQEALDAHRFERLVTEAVATLAEGDPRTASA